MISPRTAQRPAYPHTVVDGGSNAVRLLTVSDIDRYLRHVADVDAGSGAEDGGHSHAYSRSDPLDLTEATPRERTRWTTPTDQPGWRRAWGLFDREELVGHLYLAGGSMRTDMHRVNLGMGVARSHRRQGGGTRLLETAIAWALLQPGIDWIDLGVFSDNASARALYARHGFQVTGAVLDRFRVDGQSLDELSMTLDVARVTGTIGAGAT